MESGQRRLDCGEGTEEIGLWGGDRGEGRVVDGALDP